MKSPGTHQFGFGLRTAAILFAFAGASLTYAGTISYSVDINTSALVGNANGPYALDFQWNFGSVAGQTATISDLQLAGGSLVGGSGVIYSGNATGDLATSLSMTTNSTNLAFNEFAEQITGGVTNVRFSLTLSGAFGAGTPSEFVASIDDNSTFQIPTTAPDGISLVDASFNGVHTAFSAFSSTGASGGVTATIPDVASTGGMLAAAMLALGFGRRLSRKSTIA